jgi:Protein of unknown function (DUF2934)
MTSQNQSTNAQSARTEIRTGGNGPSLAEIRQRAFEIHIERGGIHGFDLEDFLQSARELARNKRDTDTNKRDPSSTRRTEVSNKFARNNLEKELLIHARNGFQPLR